MSFYTIWFLAIIMLPIAARTQTNHQGIYVRKAEKHSKWTYRPSTFALELADSKFYIYDFPEDVASHLRFTTGTYEISDSLLVLDVDTALAISLNTGGLSFMSINCASEYGVNLSSDCRIITITRNTQNRHDKVIIVELIDDDELAAALFPYTRSLGWPKRYLKQSPTHGVRVCDE